MAYDNRQGGKRDDKPKEVHDAVCAECKKDCTVAFKPTGSKPVTCRDCFAKSKPRDSRDSRGSSGRSFSPKPAVDHTKQIEQLDFKLNKVIRQLDALQELINPTPEKVRNAPDNTVDHDALKDVISQNK